LPNGSQTGAKQEVGCAYQSKPLQSEKTLLFKHLLKEDDDAFEKMLDKEHVVAEKQQFSEIFEIVFEENDTEKIVLCEDSEDVAFTIAGYMAKSYLKG